MKQRTKTWGIVKVARKADTKIIQHAIDATADNVTELHIHSIDTGVFVLAIRRYPHLCETMPPLLQDRGKSSRH